MHVNSLFLFKEHCYTCTFFHQVAMLILISRDLKDMCVLKQPSQNQTVKNRLQLYWYNLGLCNIY